MSQELVRAFLDAMEARDLATAQALTAPSFTMTFPGGAQFTKLDELVAWSARRYRNVRKTYDAFDESRRGDATIVHCHGVMNGEDLEGRPISDVRFIDRFEVRDGRIVDQKVWNDLAIWFANRPCLNPASLRGSTARRRRPG